MRASASAFHMGFLSHPSEARVAQMGRRGLGGGAKNFLTKLYFVYNWGYGC